MRAFERNPYRGRDGEVVVELVKKKCVFKNDKTQLCIKYLPRKKY